jgi:non-canonical poly(A) RNA polymerase PAPD5/7
MLFFCVQVIAKARVPIIKFETVNHGGLAFDVSFDVSNGPKVGLKPFW